MGFRVSKEYERSMEVIAQQNRHLAPAAQRLLAINDRLTCRNWRLLDKLPNGSPFSRAQHHEVRAYAGGAIITHIPKSKIHYRRSRPL